MLILLLPLWGIFGNSLLAGVEANLSLGFKAIKLPRHTNPANCSVGNTTFAHGVTFKLDCKTQCVCENGRHACSTLCPNEQLPAPEDTISCRSPRLVEVPGHCCKMWLCENPTADVYATCHNSSIGGNWTACSQPCGLGIATRQTNTHAGCHQLSNLRLCENRKCTKDNKQSSSWPLMNGRPHNLAESHPHHHHYHHHHQQSGRLHQLAAPQEPAHRIRKGHECRSIQRLGPARIRLGECVSRKLYRPKLCGRCHRGVKCCAPAASTTIQVELLCPLNAVDPINYVQKQLQSAKEQQNAQLWDTLALEPIDQEFLQSHQIQIENKFIAVEWILKCECNQNHCNEAVDTGGGNTTKSNKYAYYNNNELTGPNVFQPTLEQQHYHENNGKQNEPTDENDEGDNDVDDSHRNNMDHNDVDNSSSEQQPDIIPYPLSVGETSWKTAKLRQQEEERKQKQWHQLT